MSYKTLKQLATDLHTAAERVGCDGCQGATDVEWNAFRKAQDALGDYLYPKEPAEKVCCTCKHVKPVSEYRKSAMHKYGLQPQCKACHRDTLRAFYNRHPEKKTEYNRRNWAQYSARRRSQAGQS